MLSRSVFFVLILALLLSGGACRSVEVVDREPCRAGPLPRPDRIFVNDFAATPADLPSWSEEHDRFVSAGGSSAPPSASSKEELELGRRLGAEVAKARVDELREMHLPAERATERSVLRTDDLVLIGAFVSVVEGSAQDTAEKIAEERRPRLEELGWL